MKAARIYTDLNLNFIPHPLTGDLTVLVNEDAIKQSFYNLINLKKGEKIMEPDESSGVYDLLFELQNPATAISLETRIRNFIQRKEPRVILHQVNVEPDEDGYSITIVYTTQNIKEQQTASIYLKRNR